MEIIDEEMKRKCVMTLLEYTAHNRSVHHDLIDLLLRLYEEVMMSCGGGGLMTPLMGKWGSLGTSR